MQCADSEECRLLSHDRRHELHPVVVTAVYECLLLFRSRVAAVVKLLVSRLLYGLQVLRIECLSNLLHHHEVILLIVYKTYKFFHLTLYRSRLV